ncbi:PAS domain-containing protein [Patescibacteria group bacterium]
MENKDDFASKYKTLVETSPDCIKLFDTRGNLLYINPGGIREHSLGSLDEAIKSGWKMTDSVVSADIEKVNMAFDRAKNGEIVTFEVGHNDEADRDVCLETMAPVINEDGEVEAIFGVSRDISEMKNTEKELLEIKGNLEEEVRKKVGEMADKMDEVERINEIMVDRELVMIRLKGEIEKLKKELSEKGK